MRLTHHSPLRTVLLLTAVLSLVLALLPAMHATAAPKTTSVTVSITSLPKGLKAKVVLRGPKGYKKSFSANGAKTFKNVKPGTYRATAKPVVVKKATKTARAGTYYPGTSAPVTIAAKTSGTVTLDFANLVAPRVNVPKTSAIRDTTVTDPTPGSTGSLTVAGAYKTGDIIVAGVTAETPEGLLAKVTAVKGDQGGATTYSVVTVPLTDVVPQGDFSVPLGGTASLNGDSAGSTQSIRPHTNVTNPFIRNITCSASASMQVEANISSTITTDYHADWNWRHPSETALTVGATSSLNGHVGASVTGATSCDLAETGLGGPVQLGVAVVQVGPVPVVLKQSMEFFVEGHAGTQATVATSADAVVSTHVSATARKSGLETGFDGPTLTTAYQAPSVTATGDAELTLGARFASKVYGVAGPYVIAKIGPHLQADTTANPWWKLDAHFRLGLGIKGFGIDKSNDHLIDVSRRLADAGGPLSTGDGSGSGGSGGGTGTGGGGGTTPAPAGGTALRTILSYGVVPDLGCQLYSNEDRNGEFFSNRACGTFASVDGTLYRPSDIPAGSGLNVASSSANWTPVSQTAVGSGSAGDPYTITTTADAGSSGIRLVQTDRWASNGTSIPNTIRLRNTSGSDKTVRLYRGFDCYIGDDDTGTGELALSGQLAGCLRTTTTNEVVTLRLQALTPGATVTEARYSEVWSQIGQQGDLNNGCRCNEDIDNGVGAGWSVTVPANSSVVLQSEISMTRP